MITKVIFVNHYVQVSDSIQEVGLLHPVVIDENNNLIAGQRRIEVCKQLEWDEIPATEISLDDIVYEEFHENHVRQNFTIQEAVAIKKALDPKIKEEAKIRQKTGKPYGDSTQGQKCASRKHIKNHQKPLFLVRT